MNYRQTRIDEVEVRKGKHVVRFIRSGANMLEWTVINSRDESICWIVTNDRGLGMQSGLALAGYDTFLIRETELDKCPDSELEELKRLRDKNPDFHNIP